MSDSDDYRFGHTKLSGHANYPLGRPIAHSIVFIIVVSLIFVAFPGIDVWFTGLFYDPEFGFPLSKFEALNLLRSLGRWLTIAAVVAMLAAICIKLARPEKPTPIPPSNIVFLLSALALGPGLLVNGILKQYWGRPRPMAIEFFGGDVPFISAWQISDHCLSNCSFVSGEASAAIWIVMLTILVPLGYRRATLISLSVLAVALSLNRVAFGRHFLSDVFLAWGLTLLVLALTHRLVVERPPAWMRNDRLESWLARFGSSLRPGSGVDRPGH